MLKRFYRIDKSRSIAGSGLGLSIVVAIVTLHGYEIAVSDAEPGCVFEVCCFAADRLQAVVASGP